MVGDDDIYAERMCVGDLFNIGTGAVRRNNERCASCLEHIKRGQVKAATIFEATGNMVVEWCVRMLECPQGTVKQRRRSHSIGIVVAIYCYMLVLGKGVLNA